MESHKRCAEEPLEGHATKRERSEIEDLIEKYVSLVASAVPGRAHPIFEAIEFHYQNADLVVLLQAIMDASKKYGKDVNNREYFLAERESPLEWAYSFSQTAFYFLIDAGVEITVDLLIKAIENNDIPAVRKMMDFDCPVNTRWSGIIIVENEEKVLKDMTPLMIAAWSGKYELVQELLRRADPNAGGREPTNALCCAVFCREPVAMVNLLRENGANWGMHLGNYLLEGGDWWRNEFWECTPSSLLTMCTRKLNPQQIKEAIGK